MNLGGILSLTILCLVLYGWFASSITDFKERKKGAKRSEKNSKRDFSSILHLVAGLLFIVLLVYLMVTKFEILTLLLLLPSIVMYALVMLSASQTVGTLAMSAGSTPLTKDETSSLLFIGFVVGLVGLCRTAYWNETIHDEKTIIQCFLFVLEYSAYFFMIGTLSINPVKDITRLVIPCIGRIKTYYKKCVIFIKNRIVPEKRRTTWSEKLLNNQKQASGWRKYLWFISLIIMIPIDIALYLVSYVCLFLLWLPLLSLIAIIGILGKCFLGIVRWIDCLSARRVIVISFRIAIIAALLLLVALNEYGIFCTSQETTAVVEFIASVLIIPIVFEWIHSALKTQGNTE